MARRFSGWPPAALEFYEGLAADNSKAYFTGHRDTYDTAVKAPFEALGAELGERYGAFRLFRPHRDVRFSKDKSPYKTHQGTVTEGEGGEAYYCHLDAEGLLVATGYHSMAPDQLARFREAVADDEVGPDLEARLAALPRGMAWSEPALKRAPRGWSPDHPRIDLLRRKQLHTWRRYPAAKWLGTRKAIDRIVATWEAGRPVNEWLVAHVGPSTEAPDDGWG